jgi:chromosome segregation ATPase
MSDRDAYVQKLKAQIDAWNAELDKLQAEANKASADARISYEENLRQLRQERDEAMEKMAELQKATDSAWDDVREGVENAFEAMKSSMEKAWSRFRQ